MDDSDEFLQSVCQSGRQLVLSDAGKQMLNCPNLLKVQNSNANVPLANQTNHQTHTLKPENGDIKKKPSTVYIANSITPKAPTTNIIKGISLDLTRLCGEGKILKTLSPDGLQNGTIR